MGKRGKGFTRSDKDKEPRNSSKIRKAADGSYWVGSWRFTKISIVLACGLGLFFGFLGVSYISMKFFAVGIVMMLLMLFDVVCRECEIIL